MYLTNCFRRNRKKLYKWLLSEPSILNMFFREKMLGCDDCLELIRLADHPETAEKFQTYMNNSFSITKIAHAMAKHEQAVHANQKAEENARKLKEALEKQRTERKTALEKNLPVDFNISLEEMNLSARAYNCLKRHGIRSLQELANMCEDDLIRVRNLGRKSMMEVIEKVEALTGFRIPKDLDDDPEEHQPARKTGGFSIDALLDLNLDNDL